MNAALNVSVQFVKTKCVVSGFSVHWVGANPRRLAEAFNAVAPNAVEFHLEYIRMVK